MENNSALSVRPLDIDMAGPKSIKSRQDATAADAARDVARQPEASTGAAPERAAADLRLVIEEIGAGRFVYKTIDRQTGEVVSQLPREDLVKLARGDDYQKGLIVNARA